MEYTADQLPADLDSSYTFIKRYDKLIRKGNAEPEIKDFSLISESGNDSTSANTGQARISADADFQEFPENQSTWNKSFLLLYTFAKIKKYSRNPCNIQPERKLQELSGLPIMHFR